MKYKIVVVILILLTVGLLYIQYKAVKNSLESKHNNEEELLHTVEVLNSKIDSLKDYRDSLKIVIDTNKVKIIEVEKRYETIRDRIITQSVDSDCITFSNYISNYQGFISNNNSSTIKGN